VYYALRLEKDLHIPLRDGAYVVADVFRPESDGRFPIIMTMGPYSKDIHFREWNPTVDYEHLPERGPFMHWETVNPDWWVPQGYVVIRVDGRGTGKSPGAVRRLSDEEARDFYDAVEWSAVFIGKRSAVMRPTYPENAPIAESRYERLYPLLYSLDIFLPFVNLHQEHYWWPNSCATGEFTIGGSAISVPGSIVLYYLWLQIIARWLLSAIVIAGITGLLRND
jgi:hypothetical protein